MWRQEQVQKKPAWLAAVVAAACIFSAAAERANAYGPLIHTLIAYKAKDETNAAFGRWSLGSDDRRLSASMAGALLHDVGYVDDKLKLLSDLLHYQATGAFVDRFLGTAVAGKKWDVVGFGLGLALHYAGDRQGHYWATNRVVALLSSNKIAIAGTLAYEDAPDAHTCVERWLDAIAVSDRKLLPEKEITEFLIVLDGLAGFIEEVGGLEPGLFSLVLEPLSSAIQVTYGVSVPILVDMGSTQAAYAALLNAYRLMLNEIAIALRIAEDLYGLKVDYSKLRYWPKLQTAALAQVFKICGPKRQQLEQIVKDTGLLVDSINKSTALYSHYLVGTEHHPNSAGDTHTIWAPGKSPPDVNLDTNLISAEGEYWLADEALKELARRTGKVAVTPEYVKLGKQRSATYFEKTELSRIEQQVRFLDEMERKSNEVTAAGRESPPPLPAQLPEFRIGGIQRNCKDAPAIRLSRAMTIKVTKAQVCLPDGADVLVGWIGALAAAERASLPAAKKSTNWGLIYRSACYAYFPRTKLSKPDVVAQCSQ